MAENTKEEKEFNFKTYIGVAICMFIIVISAYIWNFNEYKISEKAVDWGTFGDFVGGTLNPTLAFLSFLALLQTIRIQSKELKKSSEALELSKEELSKSSRALEEQSASLKIQNFESTFFNMINLHKEIIDNLSLISLKKEWKYDGRSVWFGTKKSIPEKDRKYLYSILDLPIDIEEIDNLYGKKVISKLFEILNCYIKTAKDQNVTTLYYNFYKEYNEIIGHYFRNIYHILKFIKKNSEKKEIEIDSKFYTNILRAQLSNSELALLLLNALSKYGKDELLPLLIEYEFMEPLPKSIIDESYLNILLDLCDDKKIFGKSEEWKEYITSLNTSSQKEQ